MTIYALPLALLFVACFVFVGCDESGVSPSAAKYSFDDVRSEASKEYQRIGELVAAMCGYGDDSCEIARAGAKAKHGMVFQKPTKNAEVAQAGQLPKPLPLEQVAQAYPVPTVAKVASKALVWGDMTPRQRWEHYKVGHGLPEWDTLKPRERYQYYAKLVAKHEGIPPDLFWAQLMQESGYDPKVCSHVGACGLGQFMPATAKAMGLHDRTDPWESIHKAAKYMLLQHKRTGSWELALAAYNAGYGAVRQYGGVPPYRETQNYVRTIMEAMKG